MSERDGTRGRDGSSGPADGRWVNGVSPWERNGQVVRNSAHSGREAAGEGSHFAPCGNDVGRPGAHGQPGRYLPSEPFVTESGAALPGVELSFRTWGQLSLAADNAVVVCHALTGSADLEAWWPALLGPGRALDPARLRHRHRRARLGARQHRARDDHADGEPWARRFPGSRCVTSCVRSSWCSTRTACAPCNWSSAARWAACRRSSGRCSMRACARWRWSPRRRATRRGQWAGARPSARRWPPTRRGSATPFAARAGLAAARAIAMLSYRAPRAFKRRFGRRRGDRHPFAVADWLAHHGEALVRRFDPLSYATLLDAMDTHDIGAGRGGVAAGARRGPAHPVARSLDRERPALSRIRAGRARPRARRTASWTSCVPRTVTTRS